MSDDKTETEPALPKPNKEVKEDQVVKVIGEVGRWQLEKILIVFIAAAPGLAHIFHAGFITPKQKFWCTEAETSPPWTVEYNYTDVTVYPGNMTPKEDKQVRVRTGVA